MKSLKFCIIETAIGLNIFILVPVTVVEFQGHSGSKKMGATFS